jgi:hypothetical protein
VAGELVWRSTGGTVTIGAVDGTTFSFTIQDATMAVVSGTNAMGTFTLNGTGMASLENAVYPAGCPCSLVSVYRPPININDLDCLSELESYEQGKGCP